MDQKIILILPGCDDNNRGDQALIWESVRLAKEAGFIGHYYMLSDNDSSKQSEEEGINSLAPILPHPSTHYKNLHDNRRYSLVIKLLWGLAAVLDLLRCAPLNNSILRAPVKVFLSKKQRRTLEMFEKADFAIVKGGGFLHSSKGMAEIYKIYYFLYHINLALALNIPVFVMPNSYGPFSDNLSRKMVKKTLIRCRLVLSRESISQRILKKQCNINSLLAMDLGAYLLKDSIMDSVAYLRKHHVPIKDKQCVALTVRPYRFPDHKNPEQAYNTYKNAIVEMIKYLIKEDYYPVLIEHVFSDNYNECDIKCIDEIRRVLEKEGVSPANYSIIADRQLNSRQIKAIYSHFDFMIGTRFHSVIFSLFEYVPSIAITYGGNKGQGIMRDLGLSEFAVSIETVDAAKLILMFQNLCKQRKDVVEILKSRETVCQFQREEIKKMLIEDIR